MVADFPAAFAARVLEVAIALAPSTLAMVAICTLLYWFSSQACNPGTPWWRNRGLITDAWYWLIVPFAAPYIRLTLLFLIAGLAMPFVTQTQLSDYIDHGYGPLGRIGFWGQIAFYLIAADFLLYWIHRIFHGETMWRFHVIHHSAQDVDWTTAYRFHPVNLCLGPFLVDVLMLYVGVSPKVLIALAPLQTMTALFVHANLNWTLGPLKYVVATPVFHRWHHGPPELGGNMNFAPMFSLWDYLFGTFYMPEGATPDQYGVADPHVPQGFLQQLIYPFTEKARPENSSGEISASPSAIVSAGPRPGS